MTQLVAHRGALVENPGDEPPGRVSGRMNPSDVVDVVFCDNSLNRIELEQMARHYPSWGAGSTKADIARRWHGRWAATASTSTACADSKPHWRAACRAGNLWSAAPNDPSQYAARFQVPPGPDCV
ncbi:MAG: hypothetical protein IPG77_04370 [Betaproteobacteria bacterium]|nr:hypothetical protein [Betaproteobacteria bacterium]